MFTVFYSLEALVMEALVADALVMEVVTEAGEVTEVEEVTGDGDDVAIPPWEIWLQSPAIKY